MDKDAEKSQVEQEIEKINEKIAHKNIIDDNTILGKFGIYINITDELLGSGSYGKVFLATDENDKKVAIKCCDILDRKGIPDIMEPIIMKSIIHPFINSALRIHVSENKLYMIQDLAKNDLAKYTRLGKYRHKPNIEELRRWCFSLSQAVAVMHKHGIIHCDIKASNVLLFDDGNIKLTDFTLAVKKWNKNDMFNGKICTVTHRPLECFLRQRWSEPVDIWSLGCTFYEIAYGDLLFSNQGSLQNTKNDPEEYKKDLRSRSINAILDWHDRVSGKNKYKLSIPYENINYLSPKLSEEYHNTEMLEFNNLLEKMLETEADKRLTIKEVLKHPFFKNASTSKYITLKRRAENLSVEEYARVIRHISKYTDNSNVQSLALEIYKRCSEIKDTSEHLRATVCTWLAHKIIYRQNLKDINLSDEVLMKYEKEICHILDFKFNIF